MLFGFLKLKKKHAAKAKTGLANLSFKKETIIKSSV